MRISEILNRITRNDKVIFFFKKYDTHGFACSYIFRSYFEKHEMLDKLMLVAVKDDEIELTNEAIYAGFDYVFLCDLDLTQKALMRLSFKSIKAYVIDVKFTTTQKLLPNFIEEGSNISFIQREERSPVQLVWEMVHGSEDLPEFVKDLGKSYMIETSGLGSNKTLALKYVHPSYEQWKILEDNEAYQSINFTDMLQGRSLALAMDICLRNSVPFNIAGHRSFLINVNRHLMDEVAHIAIKTCEIVVTYEKTDDGYFYSIYSAFESSIDLIKLFEAYNCQGFSRRIWFITNNFIFDKKPNMIQRFLRKILG